MSPPQNHHHQQHHLTFFNFSQFQFHFTASKMWEFNCTYVILIIRFVFDSFSCVYWAQHKKLLNERHENLYTWDEMRREEGRRGKEEEMFMFVFMLLLVCSQIIIKRTRLKQQSRKISRERKKSAIWYILDLHQRNVVRRRRGRMKVNDDVVCLIVLWRLICILLKSTFFATACSHVRWEHVEFVEEISSITEGDCKTSINPPSWWASSRCHLITSHRLRPSMKTFLRLWRRQY